MKKIFPFLLYTVSFRVALGLISRQDMWLWIVVYWVVLTLKNILDLLEA